MLCWWRSPLRCARRAARGEQWAQAATAYRKHLEREPRDTRAWVQLGHSLKEQGRFDEAAAAYRRATQIAPAMHDAWIHLARLEPDTANRENAIQAITYGLTINPDDDRAVAELVEMGARERLPVAIQERIEARDGVYAASRYTLYLRALKTRRSIAGVTRVAPDALAVIDARGAAPDRLSQLLDATRATLGGIKCVILTDEATPAEIAHVRAEEAMNCWLGGVSHLLLVEAGCRIEPDALERLRAAVAATAALAAYCDHDHWEPADTHQDARIVVSDPCFQPMFDQVWFRRAQVRPPCMLVTTAAIAPGMVWGELFAQRLSLETPYAHVPIILASRCKDVKTPEDSPPATPRGADHLPIQVIIQTRDAPEMLERCVASLLHKAARPDRLDIVIVDNRSVLARTADLLARWSAKGTVRVMPHDEPFNWARANNLAVQEGETPYLLFLNNDVEMESARWDEALCSGLADETIGALGALLIYPDRLIQHAGVVFGMGTGGGVHEGVGHPVQPGGPAGRWQHPRLSAAVTGAWLATSRRVFNEVGGFEERLPVAYNDIDFCFRCRLAGRLIMEASQIVAVHRESATRGRTMLRAEQVRDHAHLEWLRGQWGDALKIDPAYNPNWARMGQPFDALRMPAEEEIAQWITASARQDPWSI